MTEQQADYKRLEHEKFLLLSWSCPWRNTPKINGNVFCLATTEVCAIDDCAIWHIAKAMVE